MEKKRGGHAPCSHSQPPFPLHQGTAEFAGVCAGTAGLGRHAPLTPPLTDATATSTSAPNPPQPPLPPPSPTRRGGFAGISAVEPTDYLDLSPYDTLTLRVRGDGRPYIASLRTENWLVGGRSHDVWQAFLLAPPGQWAEVSLPLSRFLLTHRGRLVEARVEMNAARVISFGLGLANTAGGSGGGVDGGGSASGASPSTIPPAPFRLGLDWVRAESRTRGVRQERGG
jgi:hypothetical protein